MQNFANIVDVTRPFSDFVSVVAESSNPKTKEINIGLDVFGAKNGTDEIESRKQLAMRIINSKFKNAKFRFVERGKIHNPCTGHDGNEPTLIASVQDDSYSIGAVCNDLSTKLQQWAVAYYDVESNVGNLVGPKAKKWGGFNRQCFMRF